MLQPQGRKLNLLIKITTVKQEFIAFCELGFYSDIFYLLSFISISLSIGLQLRRSKSYVFSQLYSKFERKTLTNNQTRWYYIGVGLEMSPSVHFISEISLT